MPRVADLGSPAARLSDALDLLAARWSDTRELWDDGNSRSLEESHLKPLGNDVAAALAACRHLSDVLAKAERECESP